MSSASSLSPQPSGWCLRFLSGALRGRTIALKPGANVLGSGGECDVMLPGGDVLPRHLVFDIGELVVSMQKVGAATASLNGEPMQPARRSLVAGDIVSVGKLEFQLDRVYATLQADERMFAVTGDPVTPPAHEGRAAQAPARPWLPWAASALVMFALAGIVGLSWSERAAQGAGQAVNLGAVEKVLSGYAEVEAVAGAAGSVTVRGFVESRGRKQALEEALKPFGTRVTLRVLSAEELVEQARRFVSHPGVSVSYAGQGRLSVSGSVDDEAVRLQVRRLSEDLHPLVLVSDKVSYKPRPANDGSAEARAQWAAWQNLLPSRMVGITEDASGMKHIQLANGSRYYEGALLRSGAELKHIDIDGLVVTGATPGKVPAP